MTAPVTAREPSVPTEVMFVYAVALLRFAFVMTPAPVRLVAVVAVLAATLVMSEPFKAGRKPAAVVCTSWLTPLKVFPARVTLACSALLAIEVAGSETDPLATVRPVRPVNPPALLRTAVGVLRKFV